MKSLLPIITLLLAGCPGEGPDDDTGHAMDWDVDGWFGRADCDDRDPDVNPDAEEVCDGVDNNCDGAIDEGWEDSQAWYADADADGYGDAMVRALGCEQPSGFVQDHSDCDDSDPAVHPGAEDTWYDGVDSDCEGNDDSDADADGHPWLGEGEAEGDCDDQDPDVHPGAMDWGDERDGDCDGVVDAAQIAQHSAAVFGGTQAGELGAALLTVPDQDGDGVADLLLGSPGIGAAWLVAGPITSSVQIPGGASARLQGEDTSDRAASALALAGDTDGDGVPELLLGAWLAADGRGAAYLLEGPVGADLSLGDAPWRVEGENPGDYLGYALAGVGDSDGDGFDDLLLGARGWRRGPEGAGAAYLLRGGPGGPEAVAGAAMVTGIRERDFAGSAVAGPGDLDGDGLDDLVVGARGEDSGGGAFVLLSPLQGVETIDGAAGRLRGVEAYDYAGWSVAGIGDSDGDGYRDLVVGAYGHDTYLSTCGAAYLIRGRVAAAWAVLDSLAQADLTMVGERSHDRAGWAVAGPGDVDGDGLPDLIVGAPGADLGQDGSGTVYLLLHPGQGVIGLADADLRLRGEAGDAVGTALAQTGDHDGDGLPDLLLGVPGHSDDDAGAAWVLGLHE